MGVDDAISQQVQNEATKGDDPPAAGDADQEAERPPAPAQPGEGAPPPEDEASDG